MLGIANAGRRWLMVLSMCAVGGVARAQPPATGQPPAPRQPPAPQTEMTVPSDGSGLMTMHVYSNLIQMPVLVLSPSLLPVPPIPPEKFTLSIDGGPRYKPTHVRPEGADPISLAIVLDFRGEAEDLMPKVADTIESLMAKGLTPRDHVTLFVMQCGLYVSIDDQPAEPGMLQPKIAEAVAAWTKRSRMKHAPPCEEKIHLWDALGAATMRLSHLPGRRVIVAVTDGVDRGSRNGSFEVTTALQMYAVTVFGVRPEVTQVGSMNSNRGSRTMLSILAATETPNEPFDRLCQLSGGMTLPANSWNAGKQLAAIPALVRGRYILEFPRPWNTTSGSHSIDVQVAKSINFIRASGTSVPLPDPKLAADPTTLPSDPALTPQMGKSKHPANPPR